MEKKGKGRKDFFGGWRFIDLSCRKFGAYFKKHIERISGVQAGYVLCAAEKCFVKKIEELKYSRKMGL